MDQAIEFSERMAKGNLIPAHLKNPADCLRVVLQAATWKLNPFAVGDKTSIISGKLMYEGQLVAAVVNARGNLSSKLKYDFTGEGDARVLTVSGIIRGEDEARTIELPFTLAKKINKNGQMGINPDQQATYIGARLWARRHMPELMLGVYTPDEIDPDEPRTVNPEGGEGAPQREQAPPRADTGAAGATRGRGRPPKDKGAVIDVPATESKGETATTKPPEGKVFTESSTAATKDLARTALNDGEIVTLVCRVKEFHCDMVKLGGVDHATVVAELLGQFSGKVYHIDGAGKTATGLAPLDINGSTVTTDTAWQTTKPVAITLRGKARKDPKLPNTIYVDAIKIQEPVAPAGTEPAASESVE